MINPDGVNPIDEEEAQYRARRSQTAMEGALWTIASSMLSVAKSMDLFIKGPPFPPGFHDMDEQREPPTDEETAELGRNIWHSTEEGGGPDVGMSIGMGGSQYLWIGEITDDVWNELDDEQKAQTGGRNSGWWLMTADRIPLAHFVDALSGQEFAEDVLSLIGRARARGAEDARKAAEPEIPQ